MHGNRNCWYLKHFFQLPRNYKRFPSRSFLNQSNLHNKLVKTIEVWKASGIDLLSLVLLFYSSYYIGLLCMCVQKSNTIKVMKQRLEGYHFSPFYSPYDCCLLSNVLAILTSTLQKHLNDTLYKQVCLEHTVTENLNHTVHEKCVKMQIYRLSAVYNLSVLLFWYVMAKKTVLEVKVWIQASIHSLLDVKKEKKLLVKESLNRKITWHHPNSLKYFNLWSST